MIKAVIFDFDGVIGNTMTDNCTAWQNALALHNIFIQPIEYYVLEGMGKFQIAQHFVDKYSLDSMLVKTIAENKEHFYKKDNSFKIYPEVNDILTFLHQKGLKLALVTGASRQRISASLPQQIAGFFDVVVTSDDVEYTKPHPQPYLKAIDFLKTTPAQCIVVENALLGIQSAKAAHCVCYALQTTLDESYLTQADEIFGDHSALFSKFKSVLNSNQLL